MSKLLLLDVEYAFSHSDIKKKDAYENKYCNCTAKYIYPPWCAMNQPNSEPRCVLNGGLESSACPGAIRLTSFGKKVDDYTSDHPSICNKAKRK